MKSSGRNGLTGQMVSFGVPSSCTIRSTCCISELPGSRGLWASNSAKMQPTALQDRCRVGGETSTQPPSALLLQTAALQKRLCPPPHPQLEATQWSERLEAVFPHHISMAVVCVVVPKRSSGARYLQGEGKRDCTRSCPTPSLLVLKGVSSDLWRGGGVQPTHHSVTTFGVIGFRGTL